MNPKTCASLAALLLIAVITALQPAVFAAETAPADVTISAPEHIPTLETITVIGRPEDPLTGSNTLDRTTLEHLPAKNASINEAISVLPGVQLAEQARPSLSAGEILPPSISISGGKTYQNNILIDGATSNNLINPISTNSKDITFVPGYPQTLFINTRLVKEINVYRYNIPSSFGSFTGGVVDVQTRKPDYDFWGELNYRTTRDSWTEVHIDKSIRDEFNSSNSEQFQPNFEHHDTGIILNIPLNEKFSLLTAYQLNHSNIPLNHIGQTENQTRRNENFLAKLAWEIDSQKELTAQIQYAPYRANYFLADSKDSDYTINAGSTQASLTYKQNFDFMEMTLFGAGKMSWTDRNSPPNLREWLANVDGTPSSKPWGNTVGTTSYDEFTSKEGGVGSLVSSQDGYQMKADFALVPSLSKNNSFSHQIDVGLSFEHARGAFEREEETSVYFLSTKTIGGVKQVINANPTYIGNVNCGSNTIDCIDGEQVLLQRQYYTPDSASAEINFFDVYVEDNIKWKQLNVRPGLRVSYDDFMQNIDVAPRLAISYDAFNNGDTIFIAGWNRYFGRALLHYKLREASKPYIWQTRSVVNNILQEDWSMLTEDTRIYKYSELDTPYSDELVLGLNQKLFGGNLKLNWVQRIGNDEFSRERTDIKQEDGKYHYTMTNNGNSRHDEYTLEWERYWKKYYLSVNATYQETVASNESYLEDYETEDLDTMIWYKGDLIHLDEIPRQNFSRPWVANAIFSAHLPQNFTFTNVTKYRSGYEGLAQIVDASEKEALRVPTGVKAFHEKKMSESWVFDWRLDWEKKLLREQSLILSLEINNVFDQKVELGDPSVQMPVTLSTYQSYELGRQFWLGMTYKF